MPSATHLVKQSVMSYTYEPLEQFLDISNTRNGDIHRFQVASAVLMCISTLFVIIRLWCRYFLQFGVRMDDWLILAGLVFALFTMGCFHVASDINQAILSRVSFEQHQLFWLSLSGHLFPFTMALVKISVFAMYYRVFPTEFMRQAFRIISVPVLAWMIILELMLTFKNKPFSSRWDLDVVGVCIIDEAAFLTWQCVIETALDILGFTHVIAATCQLQVSMDRKLKIIGIFMLGCLATITSLLRIPYAVTPLAGLRPQEDPGGRLSPNSMVRHRSESAAITVNAMAWLDVHLCVSVVCACLPTLAAHARMVLKKFGVVKSAGIWHHHNLIGGTHNVGHGQHVTNHSYDDIPEVPTRKKNTVYEGTDYENRTRSTLRSIYGDQPIPIELRSRKRSCSRGLSPSVGPSDCSKDITVTIQCPKPSEVTTGTSTEHHQEQEGAISTNPTHRFSNMETVVGSQSVVSGTELQEEQTNEISHAKMPSQNFSKPLLRRPSIVAAPTNRMTNKLRPERPFSGQTRTTLASIDSLWLPVRSGSSPPTDSTMVRKDTQTIPNAKIHHDSHGTNYTTSNTHTHSHTSHRRYNGWCSPRLPPPTRPLPTPTGSPRSHQGHRQASVERGRRMQRDVPTALQKSSSAFDCYSSWYDGDDDDLDR